MINRATSFAIPPVRIAWACALLAAQLAFIGCDRPGSPGQVRTPPDLLPAVLRVGPHAFSDVDVEARAKIVQLKYPDNDKARTGSYAQLVQGYLLAEVLDAMGSPVREADLDGEIARINRDTRDLEGLKRIKDLCGGEGTATYRRVAILPDFANRRFYFEIFPSSKEIHRDRFQEAQSSLIGLQERPTTEDLTPKMNPSWQQRTLTFSALGGFRSLEKAPLPRLEGSAKEEKGSKVASPEPSWERYERELFQETPQSAWVNRVIEFPEGFALMRWTRWEDEAKGVRRIEQLWLPQRHRGADFWEQAKKIPVWVSDPKIREELQRTVSWASQLNWQ